MGLYQNDIHYSILHEFLLAIRFVLNLTFSFNNTVYQQIFGIPMGSPLSPVIVDNTLQKIWKRGRLTLLFNHMIFRSFLDMLTTL